ncbi:MAG: aldehyde dehydrogenase [Oscillospiraceae bacterium]|nr:aldehyde dehydrogenase [Oscillospiraceae bacterium]
MTEQAIHALVERQRGHFQTGATLDTARRLAALTSLRDCVRRHEAEIAEALRQDLGKSGFESYMCETGLVLEELTYMLRHTRSFARERTVPTPLAQFHSRSYRKPSPRGVALIMSPWNYPFLLTMGPLADALAAGCTAVVKPSAYAPQTSRLMAQMIEECFPLEYVAAVTGGRAENTSLLGEDFDTIFFTGSQTVGREVMRRAAERLIPVTLELGGKSPCIVEKTANLKLAARRIVFGKYLNCGQTCVAPDYVLCHEAVKDDLLAYIRQEIVCQFGEEPLDNSDYGRIVNVKHFNRLINLMDSGETVHGGGVRRETLQIEPTVLDNVRPEDPVMGEEIFGPLLPVLTFRELGEAVSFVNARPHPLALYLFTSSRASVKEVMGRCGFGGGCVNDTIIHLATSQMGFGGFRESGMGAYHGKAGFDAFSHYKSIVDKKTWLDLPMRYQPYKKANEKLIRFFLK